MMQSYRLSVSTRVKRPAFGPPTNSHSLLPARQSTHRAPSSLLSPHSPPTTPQSPLNVCVWARRGQSGREGECGAHSFDPHNALFQTCLWFIAVLILRAVVSCVLRWLMLVSCLPGIDFWLIWVPIQASVKIIFIKALSRMLYAWALHEESPLRRYRNKKVLLAISWARVWYDLHGECDSTGCGQQRLISVVSCIPFPLKC